MGDETVTGRLAPSPTGALHLGHALSFVAAWCSARAKGGRIVLRLEDLDGARASTEYAQAAILDMKWLGLDWDGEPIVQSTRRQPLVAAAERLLAEGAAYPCVCTRKELRQAGTAEEETGAPHGAGPRYPGTCRGRFATMDDAESTAGREAGIRFSAPDESTDFQDAVYGRIAGNVAKDIGDFMVLRRDKTPAYQLAVVVDDASDGVSEVVRGRDLLDSTLRQIALARVLALPSPQYAHVPLVCDASGRRLAKRDDDRSLSELRSGGTTPEQIISWAARSLGQQPLDDLRSLGRAFDWSRVPRHDVILPAVGETIF